MPSVSSTNRGSDPGILDTVERKKERGKADTVNSVVCSSFNPIGGESFIC